MNYRKSLATIAFAVGATAAATAFADVPNLVTNGGFETGDFSGWNASVDLGVSGIDHVSAHTGNFGAYFGDSGTSGSISQSFATVAGTSYDIDLWLRSDGLVPNGLQVLWNGTTVYSVSDFGSLNYAEIVIDPQQAASGLSTLELRAGNDNGFLEMDDITVTAAVPEPTTYALVGAGLLMIWVRRKTASSAQQRRAGGLQ
jgi:PEP-CTERM motif